MRCSRQTMHRTYYYYCCRLCSQYNLSILYFISTLKETEVCDDESEYIEVYFGVWVNGNGIIVVVFKRFCIQFDGKLRDIYVLCIMLIVILIPLTISLPHQPWKYSPPSFMTHFVLKWNEMVTRTVTINVINSQMNHWMKRVKRILCIV